MARAARRLATVFLLVCMAGTATHVTAASWYDAGYSTSDDGGSWRFDTNVGEDLINAGLTYMRVTSGGCETPPFEAFVFEAQAEMTEAGDGSWFGRLQPVGDLAMSLTTLEPTSGDLHLIPAAGGTEIVTGLDGVPPGVTFEVCLREP